MPQSTGPSVPPAHNRDLKMPDAQGQTEFFEVLRMRRSIRAFLDQPIEEEKLQRILATANSAPSAGNLQAFEIVVVRDAQMRADLARASSNQPYVAQAPLVLAFCAHTRRSEVRYGAQAGEFFALQDATIACAYAELATAALGLGTVWIGVVDPEGLQRIMGVPAEWRPIGLLPIGYRAQAPPPTSRRHLHEVVHEHSTRVL